MKKFVAAALFILAMTTGTWAQNRGAQVDRVQTASTILSQIMSAPDRAIPDGIMSGAKCIAVVPSMLKASFVFGANYGKGVATCRTDHGWSAPVFFKVTGGSFGFQAGGQASDLVLIIRTDDGMQHLLQSKFKLGADASAAAGPVGRDAQASTDLTLRAQVLTYSRSRGLFLGVSLSGGVIRQDDNDTRAFYGGKDWTFYSLLNGQVPPPQDSLVFLNMVEKYAPTPRIRAQATPAPLVTAPAVVAAPVETPTKIQPAAPAQVPAEATDPASDEQAAPDPAATPNSPTSSLPATPSSSVSNNR